MENLDDDLIRKSDYDDTTLSDYKAEYLDVLSPVKNGRVTIMVIAIFQTIAGLYEGYTTNWDTTILIINGVFSAIYFVLYFISKDRPFLGLLLTLIIYALLNLLMLMVDPMSMLKGVIVKIVVLYYLIMGIKHARRFSYLKEVLGDHNIPV